MATPTSHTDQFKAKVALDAIREQKAINELMAEYGIHATQINTWKKRVLSAIPEIFSTKKEKKQQDQQELVDELHRQMGQSAAERNWLKKTLNYPLEG